MKEIKKYTYCKLMADCDPELFDLFRSACQKERRTMAQFIRLACETRAKKILEEKNESI